MTSAEGSGQETGSSYMALIGAICSVNPANPESPRRFSLRNEDGFFSIHLDPELAPELAPALRPGAAVCVVGQVKTYYQPRRQTHQVIVNAVSVSLLENERTGPALSPALIALVKLVTDQVTQALTVSLCDQGHTSRHDRQSTLYKEEGGIS